MAGSSGRTFAALDAGMEEVEIVTTARIRVKIVDVDCDEAGGRGKRWNRQGSFWL